MGKFIDLTGNRYGRLVIVERAENRITNSGQTKAMWKCLCDCGNEKNNFCNGFEVWQSK